MKVHPANLRRMSSDPSFPDTAFCIDQIGVFGGGFCLSRVLGGCCGVAASRWGVPDQDSRFWLLELPAFGLLNAMMVAAQRAEVTLAGAAAFVPGDGVV